MNRAKPLETGNFTPERAIKAIEKLFSIFDDKYEYGWRDRIDIINDMSEWLDIFTKFHIGVIQSAVAFIKSDLAEVHVRISGPVHSPHAFRHLCLLMVGDPLKIQSRAYTNVVGGLLNWYEGKMFDFLKSERVRGWCRQNNIEPCDKIMLFARD